MSCVAVSGKLRYDATRRERGSMAMIASRADRWEQATDQLLTLTALLFLVAYALPIIWYPAPSEIARLCSVLVWLTWAVFMIDLLVRVLLADDRLGYIKRKWFDLLVLALPLLRPLRLARLVTLLSALNRRAITSLRGKVVTYLLAGTILLGFCSALAVLDAERTAPGANIVTLGDAAWWTLTTLTTVGYGDRYPVTGTGRLLAGALMLGGIGIISTVTATFASWFAQQVAEQSNDGAADMAAEIRHLREEVARLRESKL